MVYELLASSPKLWRGVALDKPAKFAIDGRLTPDQLPPLLLVMGEQDSDLDSMKQFVSWASTNGAEIKSVLHANSGHITYNRNDLKDTQDQITVFFLRHLL